MTRYRRLEHTADIKVEVFGADRAELFANAAFCVTDVMLDAERVEEVEAVPVSLRSGDAGELLMDWLRELLFLFSSRGFAWARAEVASVGPDSVSAVLHGEPYRPEKHGLKAELKMPTYHEYKLEETDVGWRAVVVFDA